MKPSNIIIYLTLVFDIYILIKYCPKIINYNFYNWEMNFFPNQKQLYILLRPEFTL